MNQMSKKVTNKIDIFLPQIWEENYLLGNRMLRSKVIRKYEFLEIKNNIAKIKSINRRTGR